MSQTADVFTDAQQVAIDLGDRSYPILIGRGLFGQTSTWSDLPKATQAVVVSNSTVHPLYGDQSPARWHPFIRRYTGWCCPMAKRTKTGKP